MDKFNDKSAFDPGQSSLMKKIIKKRKQIKKLKKKYETDPDGNGYQRALNVQRMEQELSALLAERKFEKI